MGLTDNLWTIISVDIKDKKAEYRIISNFTSQTEENYSTGNILLIYITLSILVFQFDNVHPAYDCFNCYGNKNTDQAELMLLFTETVVLCRLGQKSVK